MQSVNSYPVTNPRATKMSTLGARIKKRMDELGLIQDEVAKQLGVSQTSVSKWILGETQRPKKLYELSRILRTTPEWLLYGKSAKKSGAPDGSADTIEGTTTATPADLRVDDSKEFVLMSSFREVYPSYIDDPAAPHPSDSALPGTAFQWIQSDQPPLPVHRSVFARRGLRPEDCRALYVSGNAMAPELREGDHVLIDTTQRKVADGEIYAVTYERELYLGRLYRAAGGTLVLRTHSTDVPDRTFSPDDPFEILGRVVYRAG